MGERGVADADVPLRGAAAEPDGALVSAATMGADGSAETAVTEGVGGGGLGRSADVMTTSGNGASPPPLTQGFVMKSAAPPTSKAPTAAALSIGKSIPRSGGRVRASPPSGPVPLALVAIVGGKTIS